ncbi:MAG: YihY/virulence factor BrkB family protein [Dehalococcoidia bacterium]|nr:YihY/virulence factor BrkB family protein [Dehalococcoidia bacterium]
MAAAIAYYALFSMFPLVTLAVSVFGIIMRDDERRARVVEALVTALPVEPEGVTDSLFAVASRGPTLTLVAALATMWSASALLSVVRRSLSVAFASEQPRPALRAKAIDMVLAPVLGAAFLLSLTITASWRVLQQTAEGRLPLIGARLGWAWDLGATALPTLVAFGAFLFAFRVLPTRSASLRYLWGGALFATAGFELVKQGFALYIARFAQYDVVYGSLGGLIALLFLVYLSANMLLAGAEVAAETAHVLRGEPRRGRARHPAREQRWTEAVWAFLVGLVMAPGETAGPAIPPSETPEAGLPEGDAGSSQTK